MRYLLVIILLAFAVLLSAQEFRPLRYEEDYSMLKSDTAVDWYRKMKFMPLNRDGAAYLSFGGELRFQYFLFKNDGWGEEQHDRNGYLLIRGLWHSDLHWGKHIRSFVQLQSSLAASKLSVSPVDENVLDIHQMFVDIDIAGNKEWIFRIGRQEMMYGSQRLISVRERPNNRQAFDAARFLLRRSDVKADIFYSYYVNSRKDIFDDAINSDSRLWGLYASYSRLPFEGVMDVYYLGFQKKAAVFDDGKGSEKRHSLGMRLFGSQGKFNYDIEGLYQFGSIADKHIHAWTASANMNYRFSRLRLAPVLGLKTELISGDRHYNDNRLQTFNALYPKGAYFGLAAVIGPANLFDIHPSLELELTPRISFGVDYDIFWRLQVNDGIYGPNAQLIYSGKNIPGKFIGSQLGVNVDYQVSRYLFLRLEGTWFDSGTFLKAAGPGKDILFTGITTQLTF